MPDARLVYKRLISDVQILRFEHVIRLLIINGKLKRRKIKINPYIHIVLQIHGFKALFSLFKLITFVINSSWKLSICVNFVEKIII